jgi:tRNA threonylcarbamoyladenosine biosynthesis protein TsaE
VAEQVPGAVTRVVTRTAADTEALGRRLAKVLRAGDVLVLSGDLGAGKTTLTRGLGAGLGIRGPVTSPTFVIAREHPSPTGGPALVHVDAYRLGGVAELEDLDLQTSLDSAVTVVEWGEGLAEGLAADRLEVHLQRPRGGVDAGDVQDAGSADDVGDVHGQRTIELRAVGERWRGVDLDAVLRSPRHPTAG